MKLSLLNSSNTIETSEDFVTGDFGIDAEGLVVVSSILRDKLYNDKELAPIREYICNAWDAHVEANKKNVPLIITFPTQLEPVFKVRDFGTGLSEEQVQDLYTKYGKSTKRNSNRAIGSFGIGCKSGFCVSDSFLVTSFFDGFKTVYNCYLDENGGGRFAKISKEENDEISGIEITIPIQNNKIEVWRQKLSVFIKNITPTPKTINYTVQPDAAPKEVIFEKDNLTIYKSSYNKGVKILMGIVEYPVNLRTVENSGEISFLGDFDTVIRAKIGQVDVSANRESVEYTEKTQKYILNQLKTFSKDFVQKIQDEIDLAPTIFAARGILAKKFQEFTADYSLRYLKDLFRKTLQNKVWRFQGKELDTFEYRLQSNLFQDVTGNAGVIETRVINRVFIVNSSGAKKLKNTRGGRHGRWIETETIDAKYINKIYIEDGSKTTNRTLKVNTIINSPTRSKIGSYDYIIQLNADNPKALESLLAQGNFNELPIEQLNDVVIHPELLKEHKEKIKQRQPFVKSNLVKVQKWTRSTGRYYYWEDATIDKTDTDTKICVITSRNNLCINGNGGGGYAEVKLENSSFLFTLLTFAKEHFQFDVSTLYKIPHHDYVNKFKKQKNLKCFVSWIYEKCEEKLKDPAFQQDIQNYFSTKQDFTDSKGININPVLKLIKEIESAGYKCDRFKEQCYNILNIPVQKSAGDIERFVENIQHSFDETLRYFVNNGKYNLFDKYIEPLKSSVSATQIFNNDKLSDFLNKNYPIVYGMNRSSQLQYSGYNWSALIDLSILSKYIEEQQIP